jgi:putative FmdB family regulatory protein
MPVYEFSCSTCGKKFEKRMPFDADQKAVRCPNGHSTVRRVYSSHPIMFKGSGFYVTDHRHSSSGESDKG